MERKLDGHIGLYINSRIAHVSKDNPLLTSPLNHFLLAMQAMVGIQETSLNAGRLVESIQKTVGRAEKEAWCLSTIMTAIAYVEERRNVKCPLPATEHCMTLFKWAMENDCLNDDPKETDGVRPGDIMHWQYLDYSPAFQKYIESTRGHAGVVIKAGDVFETIEGNTGPGKEVEREGDGVFKKLRTLEGSGKMRVIGFVRVEFFPK